MALGARATTNTAGTIPLQTRRKFDRSDLIVFKEVNHAPMLTKVLRGGNKRVTTDPKYYVFEDDYEKFEFELTGAVVAGTSTTLATDTTYIFITSLQDFLKAGDALHIPAGDPNQSNAPGTVAAAGEDIIIEETIGTNAARVTRFGGAGAQAYGCTNAAAANTIKASLIGAPTHEGSTSPTALSGALTEDYNYTEIDRLPWENTGSNIATTFYAGPDEQREARLKRKTFMRNLERSWWHGHRNIRRVSGKPKRHRGGWFEFIADTSSAGTRIAVYDSTKDLITGDGTQRMTNFGTAWSVDDFNNAMEKAFQYGGKLKTGYAGPGFITRFENVMRPYVRMQWTVDKFGQKVASYQCTHGMVDLIIEPEWYNEYTNDLVIIDEAYSWYRYMGKCKICNSSSRDIHVHTNIQAKDVDGVKNELFADIGPDQKHRNAHTWLTAAV